MLDGINEANVRRWVEALESGDWPQTQGTLNRTAPGPYYDDNAEDEREAPAGFCCLGVVCELAWQDNPEDIRREEHDGRMTYEGRCDILPVFAMRWLSDTLTDSNPVLGDFPAAQLNDVYGVPFRDIAARIRRYWLDEDVEVPALP